MRYTSHDSPARPARTFLVRRAAAAIVTSGFALGLSARLAAQPRPEANADPHAVSGRVRAPDESDLFGAHVSLTSAGSPTATRMDGLTDAAGAFRFDHVPTGAAQLVVRRLGFRPESLTVEVPQLAGGAVVVQLERVAAPLAPVLVRATPRARPLPSAFERRRAAGLGHFVTRADIERRNPRRTSDLFRSIPGVSLGSGPSGSLAPRFRSTGRVGQCDPLYWLDGTPLATTSFDLDAISPQSIEAVEIYSGNATVPPALRATMAAGGCGVIAIWTRHGEYAGDDVAEGVGADSLGAMVARGWAFTADQVELAAAPLPGFAPAPAYPDSLRDARVSGRVVAEFIVDAQGRVDPETVGIVSSTHPLFAAAVRAAVGDARFSPAYREGRVVRQVVHLPVVFEPGAVGIATPTTATPRTHD